MYTVIVLLLAYPLFPRMSSTIIGAGGDSFYEVWSLWWFKRALALDTDPAHTHAIFALLPSIQIFSDHYFDDVLAVPLQEFMTPAAAYNTIVLSSFILGGLTMYLLAGEFVDNHVACFTAGFLYTFSTFHFARAEGHLGLSTLEWLPFFAWRVFRFYRRPSFGHAIIGGVSLALVPLSEIYYVPYFVLPFLALFVGSKLATDRQWFARPRNLGLSCLALAVAVLIAGPPLASSFLKIDPDMEAAIKAEAQQGVAPFSGDLMAFVLPHAENPLFGAATTPIYAHMQSHFPVEESVFLGYPTLLLALAAFMFRRNRRRATLFWLAVALSGFVLALGPELLVAGHAVVGLPFYNAVFGWSLFSSFRAPNRLVILPLTALAILAAYAIESIFMQFGRGRLVRLALTATAILIMAVSLAENAMESVLFPSFPLPIPPLYGQIAADKGNGLLLDLPLSTTSAYNYYQIVHNKAIVEAFAPRISNRAIASVLNVPYLWQFDPAHSPLGKEPSVLPADMYATGGFRKVMRENHIKYVVFHGDADSSASPWMRQLLEKYLGRPFYADAAGIFTAWRVEQRSSSTPGQDVLKLGLGWLPTVGIVDRQLQRVVQQDGQIIVSAARPEEASLRFSAAPYFRPLTMVIRLDGRVKKTIGFTTPFVWRTVNLTSLVLAPGVHTVGIHALEGCSTASQYIPTNRDPRCFSFAVREVSIVRRTV
ncbi:MAG: hypothetical protein ACR2JC_20585 [Chloroflexota bacterium]|nr:MAG: hypothetical protein DLM70_10455 [Chloroflexota bacterium]